MALDNRHLNAQGGVRRREFLAHGAGLTFALSFAGGLSAAPSEAHAQPASDVLQTAWVTIRTDNTITIMSAAAELGQGSMTSLPLIFADELDADWSKVKIQVSPSDDKLYGNPRYVIMYTAGSSGVQTYFKPLRIKAAQVRRVLLDSVATRWRVPRGELTTEPNVVVHRASGRRISYGEIAQFARMPEVLPEVAEADLKTSKDFRYIGKDTMRIDVPSKVDGSAQFSIDVQLPGMLYGAVLRTPVHGAKPATVDDSGALRIRDVVKVVSLPDAVGIVAKTPEAAFAAKASLKVTWTKMPADSFDSDEAFERYARAARNFGPEGKNWQKTGDVAAALTAAAIVVEAEYRTDFNYHAQLEPLNSVASVNEAGDGAEIWAGTQAPTSSVAAAAQALGTTPDKIVLHRTLVGGAFGRRGAPDMEFVVDSVLLSRAAKSPVKVIWTREDDVHSGRFRPMTARYLRAGLDAQGNVVAWRHRISSESALAFLSTERFKARGEIPSFVFHGSEEPYDFPNRLVDHIRQIDGIRLSAMRGTGYPHSVFAAESFMDEIALSQKADPVEFRMRHLTKAPRMREVLKVAVEMADWKRKRPQGRGLGVCLREHGGTYIALAAEVSVDTSTGAVKVHDVWAAVDAGLVVQPDNAVAQVEGAITFTLGAALFERVTVKAGKVEQNNFYDYRLPRMSDLPNIEVKLLSTDNPPMGVGEVGANVPGAIANAFAAATGVRVRHMPLTQERVLDALRAKTGA